MSRVQCVTGCENTGGRSAVFRRGSRRHRATAAVRDDQVVAASSVMAGVRGFSGARALRSHLYATRGYSPAAVGDGYAVCANRDHVQRQAIRGFSKRSGRLSKRSVIYTGVRVTSAREKWKNSPVPPRTGQCSSARRVCVHTLRFAIRNLRARRKPRRRFPAIAPRFLFIPLAPGLGRVSRAEASLAVERVVRARTSTRILCALVFRCRAGSVRY